MTSTTPPRATVARRDAEAVVDVRDAHAPVPGSTRSTRREDAVLLACASVLLVGLFLDGWAHSSFVDELEGFVTPWHAIVFAGFVLTSGWILWMVQRRRVAGRPLRAAVPIGYLPAVVAVVAFFVGFNADAVWHTVFGLEADVDALLSPSHLLMAAALVTMVSTPWRVQPPARGSWRADGTRIASLLATTLVVAFFLLYLWVTSFTLGSAEFERFIAGTEAPFMSEVAQITVLAGGFVLSAIVLAPLLLLARSPVPRGAATLLVVVPALGLEAVRELPNAWSLVAFVAAAVAAEVVLATVADQRRRVLLLGGVVPGVLWATHWIVFAAVHGTGWEAEIYSGQVISAVFAGLALAWVMRGDDRRQGAGAGQLREAAGHDQGRR